MGKIELRAQAPGPFITDSNRNDRSSDSGVEQITAQMDSNATPNGYTIGCHLKTIFAHNSKRYPAQASSGLGM